MTTQNVLRLFCSIVCMLMINTSEGQEMGDIIAREVLFGNPDKASVKVSPDGKHLSYLAPLDGVLNVYVAPIDDIENAKAVTKDDNRGVRTYFWAYTNEHIVYLQDVGGDENWQVHVVNLDTLEDRILTPFEEILGPDGEPIVGPDGKKLKPRADIQEVSYKYEEDILISLNKRNPQYFDVYRLNILSGDLEMIEENNEYLSYVSDDDYNLRFAFKTTPDGGNEMFIPTEDSDWESFDKIPMEDMMNTSPLAFNKSGDTVYMMDSRDRNTSALYAVDMETSERELIFEDPKADLSSVMIHPTEKNIEAASSNYTRVEWEILDDSIKEDIDYLESLADGDMNVLSRSLDDQTWVVAFTIDTGPVRYYLYDREAKEAEFLFTNRSELENKTLSNMHPIVIPSRDGLELVSYLTLPYWTDADEDGRPEEALPLVLLVHGGPWARDSWGYDAMHQWLSNRGYAVLSVNFRGSTGFGKDFTNAGNREWAGKMHDDLIDAVNWVIEENIADPEKIAIMGGSYGGYATLVGLTFTPDVFACGVDIVGPSNIETLLNTIPTYWEPYLNVFKTRVGDHQTEEGREFLKSRSPITFVDKIKKPLLIGQGANDPRVKQSESDQIVDAMQEKEIPVTYALYPDEGHGFARPQNRLSFYAVTEIFLSENLGGRYEEIGDDFAGSSIEVPTGAEFIPTLEDQLDG